MEAHGGTRWLARFIEFKFSHQRAICLNSRMREFEGSVAQTFVCRGRRGNYPGLQRVGLSMLCNMLGERSRTSLHLVILRDLPRTYSCTCFYSKEKQWWKQTRTLLVLNTGESKLYWIKKWGVFYFITFFVFLDYPGYLPVVLCLWSQARPWGFILQLLMLMRFPASPPFMDLSLFKLQG